MAVERAKAVAALGNHVEAVVDDAKLGLEDFISKHLAAAQANIAAAVTRTIAVPPPPPPQPTPAFPNELMKSFKADVLKAVTEATQQSFVASGLKLMTEVIGNVAAGRRASSPSANDADPAQRREADKQGRKRAGGGDDAGSVKRSKGADGGRGVGAVGPGGSRTRGQSVVDQLKKNGAKVIRSHSKGDGIGSADGGRADEVAAQDGGKGLSDKEIPTAQTAIDGGARTVKGPSVGVAGTTSIPRKPPAASSAPVGPSAANNDGPALVATPAAVGPSAAKGDAKDAAANRDGPSASKVLAAANALREMLHRMEAHRKDVQQPPLVDAAPAEAARRTVTPQVAATTPSAPHTALLVAAHPTADPKSALLRARLGARSAAAPAQTWPEAGSSATPTSVNEAAEKGVRAALATGGGAVDHAQASIGHNDADIAAIQNLLESVKRPGHPAALAISDTAHVEPLANPPAGSAEPNTTTDTVGDGESKRKGKADTVKGRASSQRKTRAMFDDILGQYRAYKSSGDAHHDALLPAIWLPVDAVTKEGQEKSDAMMSAMIGRVSMCAAYGKVAASTARKEGDTDEKTAMAAQALSASACAVWCLVENDDAQVVDAVGEGKAAAMVVGASEKTAGVFKEVMQVVLEAEIDREQPLGEVAHNVAPALQSLALHRVYPGVDHEVEADVIARATVETLAFWGMCPVAGPKLEKIGIAVPCDAQMEYDIEHRGRKGQRGKQGKDSTGKKGKKGKKGKDSTAA
ncbi:unnamed protein product [Closterium sp. Naga37s-1]|nr:unnamed protein product [Closterium sp. Naga37s-1]